MKGISHLFDKFKLVDVKEVQKRAFISDLIKKEIGCDITIENISFKDGDLIIKTSSIIKSQIFIKKSILLSKISKTLVIKDIK